MLNSQVRLEADTKHDMLNGEISVFEKVKVLFAKDAKFCEDIFQFVDKKREGRECY